LDQAGPGLCCRSERSVQKLLSLIGVATAGRFERAAFNSATLLGFERWRERVQATFAPPGWGGLLVRAAWGPDARGEAIDFEIQATARSVGELKDFEVMVLSQLEGPAGGRPIAPALRVEARDLRSASLGNDGREPAVASGGTTALPPPAETSRLERRPHVLSPPGCEPGVFYVEMAQPDDVARRICEERIEDGSTPALVLSTRYSLFGHDLEKGVILRARLRGAWIRSGTPESEGLSLYQTFLREPLPLGP
jgi:hypothetical protein